MLYDISNERKNLKWLILKFGNLIFKPKDNNDSSFSVKDLLDKLNITFIGSIQFKLLSISNF